MLCRNLLPTLALVLLCTACQFTLPQAEMSTTLMVLLSSRSVNFYCLICKRGQ